MCQWFPAPISYPTSTTRELTSRWGINVGNIFCVNLKVSIAMGLLIAKLYSLYENFGGGGQPSRILMLGLDAAGKLIAENM